MFAVFATENLRHKRPEAGIVFSLGECQSSRYCSMPQCDVKMTSQPSGRVRTYPYHVVIGR